MAAAADSATRLRIGPYTIDTATGEVWDGRRIVRLQPQTIKVLVALVARPGQLVTRGELRQHLWPDANVDFEDGLNHAMARLREALHDSAEVPRFIETIPRRGYRFISPVGFEPCSAAAAPCSPAASADAAEIPCTSARIATGSSPDESSIAGGEQQERRTHRSGAAVLLVLAVGSTAALATFTWRQLVLNRINAIAVLPLKDLSTEGEQAHIVDGLTEEIISGLGRIESLRVISRTSTQRYRDTGKAVRAIARELGVDAVVEGSVQRSGDQVRVVVQLVRARAEGAVWGGTYDVRLGDVLALRREIGGSIAGQIGRSIMGGMSSAPVPSEAYEEFLRGNQLLWGEYTQQSITRSIGHFERAVAMYPAYALAYTQLAEAHSMIAFHDDDRGPHFELAMAAARKALDLAPDLPQAQLRLANVKFYWEWDWSQCDGPVRRARDLEPNDVDTVFHYAICLDYLGRADDSLREYSRLRAIDPLSAIYPFRIGRILSSIGRGREAIEPLRLSLTLDPDDRGRTRTASLAKVLIDAGRDVEALRWLVEGNRAAGEPLESRTSLQAALARGPDEFGAELRRQDRARFERDLREAEAGGTRVSPLTLASIHAQLGDIDRAFEYLQQAYAQRLPNMVQVYTNPALEPLRVDPRFHELLRRMGLPAER